jgi:hypothetical protein
MDLEQRLDKLTAQPGTFTKKKLFGGISYNGTTFVQNGFSMKEQVF